LNSTPRHHAPLFSRLLARRHGGTLLFFLVYLAIALLTRAALLVKAAHDVTWSLSLLAAFAWGFVYDLGAAAYASLALTVVLTLLPAGWFQPSGPSGTSLASASTSSRSTTSSTRTRSSATSANPTTCR